VSPVEHGEIFRISSDTPGSLLGQETSTDSALRCREHIIDVGSGLVDMKVVTALSVV